MLQILHSLNFVHNDIKPDNMGWSIKKQKIVFLDFGISELIKESIGSKTFTGFKGSFFYCSQ